MSPTHAARTADCALTVISATNPSKRCSTKSSNSILRGLPLNYRPRVRCCQVTSSGMFDDYLKCGRLEHGFLRLRCDNCHAEHFAAFSCMHRGFCPSCGAWRIVESAALLVDEVFPYKPMHQLASGKACRAMQNNSMDGIGRSRFEVFATGRIDWFTKGVQQ